MQTRRASPVRAPSPTPPIPLHMRSQHSHGGTTQIQESDTARGPQVPRATQVQEWQQMVRDNIGSASGRLAKARAFLCVAVQPGTTSEDLQDSGGFESIDCELAAELSTVFNPELRYVMQNVKAQEHKAGRMSKGRQIYWAIPQRYKVTDVDDTARDFECLQLMRMRGDELQRFIVA
eukprot:7257441-Pyramimonas_sp.AAC.1